MNSIRKITLEQLQHILLIFRLSLYETRSQYKMHYLGSLWKFLNPIVLIAVYWFVFGLGIRGGSPIGETSFFLWLLTGLVPWLYISPTIGQATNSIYSKIAMVSKMNFPVSILPTIKMFTNSFSFFILITITVFISIVYGDFSGIYLIQLPYYLISLYILIYAITILTSSLAIIVRDVQNIIQAALRIMFFVLPIVWNIESLPDYLVTLLKLNPFYYIIEGFRYSLIGGNWFYDDIIYTIYFWLLTLVILLIGCTVHLKFRNKFVDYL
ncbi:ABC transporter permease [Lysinibacillus halotolerans]|uniref:ABC transporter permease n=1 Tax=Ureibacillus sp. FSL E2-3493 TaxID=2921367 RepID=UPI00311A19AF